MSQPVAVRAVACLALCATAPNALAQLPGVDDTRWQRTATNGGGLTQGDPTTLTWTIVADGTPISPNFAGESSDGSSLVSFLDTNVGGGAGAISDRPWFRHFESYHDRYAQISGLSYEYVTYDTGQDVRFGQAGELGVQADVRIGGHSIDGQAGSNTLAYNYFPGSGDMVIDTDNAAFYGNGSDDFRGPRNVLAHEHGHGIGQPHFFAEDGQFLMEPFVNNNFDGPQFIDIYQTQRGYGDVLEKFGGNDVAGMATDLGNILSGNMVAVGMDAALGKGELVDFTDVDFFSIDDDSDIDFFSFTIDAAGVVDLLLEPLGETFSLNLQNSSGNPDGAYEDVDFGSMSDLALALFASDMTLLGFSDLGGPGDDESFIAALDSGEYFARIAGADDAAQFYGLTINFDAAAVPEPGSWALILFAAGGLAARRRRSRRATVQAGSGNGSSRSRSSSGRGRAVGTPGPSSA